MSLPYDKAVQHATGLLKLSRAWGYVAMEAALKGDKDLALLRALGVLFDAKVAILQDVETVVGGEALH